MQDEQPEIFIAWRRIRRMCPCTLIPSNTKVKATLKSIYKLYNNQQWHNVQRCAPCECTNTAYTQTVSLVLFFNFICIFVLKFKQSESNNISELYQKTIFYFVFFVCRLLNNIIYLYVRCVSFCYFVVVVVVVAILGVSMVQNVDYNNCLMRYGRIRFSCARALCEQKYSFALVLFVFDTLSYTLLYLYRTVFSVLCDIRTKRSNSGVSHIIDTNSMCAIVYFRLRYMLQQQ